MKQSSVCIVQLIYLILSPTGEWLPFSSGFYHMDYVVFPMSFVVSEDQQTLFLTYGRRDTEGWVARIDLPMLLSSLKVVNKDCG